MRTHLIRVASARPDLRPYLLPLLVKKQGSMAERVASQHLAFVRLPRDAFAFGFKGGKAEAKGKMLAEAVKEAVDITRINAMEVWRMLDARLRACADVDVEPLISRNFIGLSMQDVHAEISRKAVPYFEGL